MSSAPAPVNYHPNPFAPAPYTAPVQSTVAALPASIAKRARGLKILLICELLLYLWSMFLSIDAIILVPVNLVGYYAVHTLRRNWLTAFIWLKTVGAFLLVAGLIAVVNSASNCKGCAGEIPLVSIIWVLIIAFQVLCIVIAKRIRAALLEAETRRSDNYELDQVEIQHSPESPGPVPVASAPYPYAPQYPYPPMPYAQPPQGYPYPPIPYHAYPPNGHPQSPPPMSAVYPTYMYPEAEHQQQPTYFSQEPTEPSNRDSDALLQNVNLEKH